MHLISPCSEVHGGLGSRRLPRLLRVEGAVGGPCDRGAPRFVFFLFNNGEKKRQKVVKSSKNCLKFKKLFKQIWSNTVYKSFFGTFGAKYRRFTPTSTDRFGPWRCGSPMRNASLSRSRISLRCLSQLTLFDVLDFFDDVLMSYCFVSLIDLVTNVFPKVFRIF